MSSQPTSKDNSEGDDSGIVRPIVGSINNNESLNVIHSSSHNNNNNKTTTNTSLNQNANHHYNHSGKGGGLIFPRLIQTNSSSDPTLSKTSSINNNNNNYNTVSSRMKSNINGIVIGEPSSSLLASPTNNNNNNNNNTNHSDQQQQQQPTTSTLTLTTTTTVPTTVPTTTTMGTIGSLTEHGTFLTLDNKGRRRATLLSDKTQSIDPHYFASRDSAQKNNNNPSSNVYDNDHPSSTQNNNNNNINNQQQQQQQQQDRFMKRKKKYPKYGSMINHPIQQQPHQYSVNDANDDNDDGQTTVRKKSNNYYRRSNASTSSSSAASNHPSTTTPLLSSSKHDGSAGVGANYYSSNEEKTLSYQMRVTRFWRILTCMSSVVIVVLLLTSVVFVVCNVLFIRPIVQIGQIQIHKLPNPQKSLVTFSVSLDTYNHNWQSVWLNNCTFLATITDVGNQVSYQLSQPIVVGNNGSQVIRESAETRIRYMATLDLSKETNYEALYDVIRGSVFYHASKFFQLKFEGGCDVVNAVNYRWNMHVVRTQQYNLKRPTLVR